MNQHRFFKHSAFAVMFLGLAASASAQGYYPYGNAPTQQVQDIQKVSPYEVPGNYPSGNYPHTNPNGIYGGTGVQTYPVSPSGYGHQGHMDPMLTLQYERDPAGLVQNLTVQPLTEGRALVRVEGTRRAQVSVRVEPRGRTVPLQEIAPGVYEGLISGLAVHHNARPVQLHTQVTKNSMQAQMVHSMQMAPVVQPQPVDPNAPVYGTVESVVQMQKEVKQDGNNVAGAIIGGVVGGALGNQVGGGSGKDIATVLGVIGGAYAGKEIAKNQGGGGTKVVPVWRVNVRLYDGTVRSVDYEQPVQVYVGQRVVVQGNQIQTVQ